MTEISAAFPYESRFQEVLESRMHYVEVGEGDPVLFLHGNPTSCYLWRNVMPLLSPQARCIALDLIGMGKSDKPGIEYRFVDHVRYVDGFIDALGLKNLTLVVHDWGSALGFHHARRNEDRVRGIAFMEAIMGPIKSWDDWPAAARSIFQGFRTPQIGRDMIIDRNIFVERVLPGSVIRKLTDEEMDRYREPFLEPASREPVWRWPNEIPIEGEPADVAAIVGDYAAWLTRTRLPKLLITASPGALMTPPLVRWCRAKLPEISIVDIGAGSHFIQEDNPVAIGEAVAAWFGGLADSPAS